MTYFYDIRIWRETRLNRPESGSPSSSLASKRHLPWIRTPSNMDRAFISFCTILASFLGFALGSNINLDATCPINSGCLQCMSRGSADIERCQQLYFYVTNTTVSGIYSCLTTKMALFTLGQKEWHYSMLKNFRGFLWLIIKRISQSVSLIWNEGRIGWIFK